MTTSPIVIVGGGAGGLELAAKLGRQYGPSQVYLIDKDTDHIWKPSLHEVAAGTLDIHREGLSYFMLARDCNFTFILGALEQLDKEKKQIQLAPAYNEAGQQLFPQRTITYGTLVIAVGSKSNFFNTPGAAEYAITLIEGAERILVALPAELSVRATQLLASRKINVCTGVRVTEVKKDQLIDQNGTSYAADLCVWAAGIQAPAFLTTLGLETNRINQQANYLYKVIRQKRRQKTVVEPFKYKDYGSLVSVGHSKGVGSLMGVLSGKSWFVEGLVARTMYMSLHLMHHAAVLGVLRTASLALGRLLLKRSAPRVKLH